MVSHGALEAAKTVLEVADVAWSAVECCNQRHRHHDEHDANANCDHMKSSPSKEEDLESLRSENQRLWKLLEQNLDLLENISQSACILNDCPPDLHDQLVAVVNSSSYMNQLKCLGERSVDGTVCEFPFNELSGADPQFGEIVINVDVEEPSWWVWVIDETDPSDIEVRSGIDNESYVIVNEEHVVDAVANFMAKCIMSNPKAKNLTPEELQKALTRALDGMNKFEKLLHVWHAGMMFYTLSMWGLALVGLYKSPAVLKLAASGVHKTSKVVLKALRR